MAETETACLSAWRAELVGSLVGQGIEIGAGTGLNLRHYGASVSRLVVTEPDRHMRAKLEQRCVAARVPIEISAASAESLPYPDESFDFAVSTLVLCTVRDVGATLGEIRRVLRPGGRLAFLEHVASEDPARYRWQRWLEPPWLALSDGCHLTRRTRQAIEAAGFALERVSEESVRKALPIVRPSVRGFARKQ